VGSGVGVDWRWAGLLDGDWAGLESLELVAGEAVGVARGVGVGIDCMLDEVEVGWLELGAL
jgi:hypothetical protein